MEATRPSLARRGAWFGLLAAASSSPGQTFFIGLFGNAFREGFGLTEAELGSIYGLATLASGVLMFWLGELADRFALRRAITLSVLLMTAGGVLLTTSSLPVVLAIALFLLRLGGQGLTGHFAVVAAARFSEGRHGRNIAITSLGFILGEAFYPLLITVALGAFDWRLVWLVIAVVLAVAYLPALRTIARPFPTAPSAHDRAQAHEEDWNRRRLLLSPAFLGALGVVLVPPFVITAVFFHQTALAERIGWAPTLVAQAFFVFAICQAITTLVAGRLVDQFGARMVTRVYLLPLAIGLLATFAMDASLSLWMLFAGLGFTAGGNSVIAGAVWVEVFGHRKLGLIRGMYAGVMVLSTAVSPALLGGLLSARVALATILLPVVLYAAVAPWLLTPLTRTAVKQKESHV